MTKRDTTKEVFVQLVNLQLAPHKKTYEDVSGDPEWYMKYKTTRSNEVKFIKAGTDILRKKLKMTKKMAEQEMSWFILQWGLTTAGSINKLKTEANKVLKSGSRD